MNEQQLLSVLEVIDQYNLLNYEQKIEFLARIIPNYVEPVILQQHDLRDENSTSESEMSIYDSESETNSN